MNIAVEGAEIVVTRPNDDKGEPFSARPHPYPLIHNMIVGVTEGFKKELEVNGVGYRVQKQGTNLVMNLGFRIRSSFRKRTRSRSTFRLRTRSSSMASTSRRSASSQRKSARRAAGAVQGKGIKYIDEVVRRKEGKTGKGK